MSDDAFDSYLHRWREADPQRATAWLFLRPAERIRFGALAALEEEWLKAVREAREPQVAATKLGWWREEMQRAVQGEARHPLLQPLFADPRVRTVPLACWTAAVDAALLALSAQPPANVDTQLATAQPLAVAFADIETRIWFDDVADSARAASVIAVAQLVSSLRNLGAAVANGRVPLPMNLMARHGLAVGDLARDGAPQRSALRDHAADLERELAQAATMHGPISLFREIVLQRDLRTLAQAACADDPMAALQSPGHGFRHLLKTWRAARIWRGYRTPEATA